ncbi:hypothetical protein ESCO_000479 [Escovopsis weberi]|uniref:Uncharacterized protein n=1 Tax=Escovopsis weberi TaxID=150374 RepID=A0A0M8MWW0_ESCWE|nr:hypothetical protein ESCO_000479 [Escovopsis weberi]
MDSISGFLLIPPDRGHILSRPVWKGRYVTIGKRVPISFKKDRQNSSATITARVNSHPDLKPLSKVFTDEFCISIFKHKVENVSYRKQEPAQPTLIVTLCDKERKRRSTRSAGLVSNKDSGASTLWFRMPPNDSQPTLQQWAHFILSKKQPASSDGPGSSLFTSPFAPRNRDGIDFHPFGGGGGHLRSDLRSLQHKTSSATYSTGRENPNTLSSDSPSLRSRRSDVSSPSSLNQHVGHTYTIDGQHYTTVLPTDAGPSGGFGDGTDHGPAPDGQGIAPGIDPLAMGLEHMEFDEISAPPAPGETILDRAFQLGQIPGAEQHIPGQENISSIARFDALMREIDEKRKKKEAATPTPAPAVGAEEAEEQKSPPCALVADDSSDGVEARDVGDHEDSDLDDSDDDDELDDAPFIDDQNDDDFYSRGPLISPSARRALDFIAGRAEGQARDPPPQSRPPPRPAMQRTYQSFLQTASSSSSATTDAQALRPQSPPQARPHTAHGRSRFNQSHRAHSNTSMPSTSPHPTVQALVQVQVPDLAPAPSSSTLIASVPTPAALPSASISSRKADDGSRRPSGASVASGDKRQSGSNSKRLSFSEFTRRLSSTSSLLLNQTTAGRGSSRGSAENEPPAPSPPPTSSSASTAASASTPATSTTTSTTITTSFTAATATTPLAAGAARSSAAVSFLGGAPHSPLLPLPLPQAPYSRKRQYREERESRKCAWRGSVGVIDEGRFM